MLQHELFFTDLVTDFLLGGVSGAVSNTLTAPIERVRLVFQTQNAIPKIRNGQVPRYTGIGYFLSHLQRAGRRGLLASQLHELHPVVFFSGASLQFVLQGFDQNYVPDYSPKQDFGMFFAVNMASVRVSAAGSPTIVYPLDYARTRLPSDVGSGKKTFDGLFDCLIRRLLAPRVSFPLRWFRRVPRRNHPVPWLPAWCLRHHRSPKPVEVRHRHDYFASTFVAAQTTII